MNVVDSSGWVEYFTVFPLNTVGNSPRLRRGAPATWHIRSNLSAQKACFRRLRLLSSRSHHLKKHAPQIWACDFTQVYNLFFQSLFVFVIIELSSRRIVHIALSAATTAHPTDAWVAQQLREATPWGEHPRFLIRDNDSKYGSHFAAVSAGSGIKILRTPIQAPNANAVCERLLLSLHRECLDHVLILNDRHLLQVTREYSVFFNHARPHRGIGQGIPIPPEGERPRTGKVIAFPVLGGLHHDYRRAA